MKTKEIIATLQIQEGVPVKKQKQFFAILVKELEEIYNGFGNNDSERHFDAAVKQLRIKWEAISKQVRYGLSDGLWNYFFATEVIKLKETLCPSWKERRDIEHAKYEERKRKREEKQAKRDAAYADDNY